MSETGWTPERMAAASESIAAAGSAAATPGTELRVLVLAPFGQDATLIAATLEQAGYPHQICDAIDPLCEALGRDDIAAVILAAEALSEPGWQRLGGRLRTGPAWSELPLLMLCGGAQKWRSWQMLADIAGTSHLHLLDRPMTKSTLLSAVRLAYTARRRQYQMRDELEARRRSEEALRRSEVRLNQIISSIQAGTWDWDLRTGDIRWSSTLFDMYSLEPQRDPVRYEDWYERVHPLDRERVSQSVFRAIDERADEWREEFRVRHPARGVRWLLALGRMEYGPGRQPRRMAGINLDITDRKRFEESLHELNERLEERVAERTATAERRARMLRRLAAELSDAEHRERKRLAGILHDDLQQFLVAGRLQLQRLSQELSGEQREYAAAVDRLLAECLSTSRDLSRELAPPVVQTGTLSDIVAWLAARFREQYGLIVRSRILTAVPAVPEHLRVFLAQALRELLLNVVKHSGQMEARVVLSWRDGEFLAEVSDRGRAFDPEAAVLAVREPAGFGLFNIRERLEALGGRFEVGNSPGGGACFRLRLPVGESRPAGGPGPVDTEAPAAASPEPPYDRPLRLMVADDHSVVRDGIVGLLNEQPWLQVVGEAEDGSQAIERAEALRPDAIVMDVRMPRVNGIEATRRIKARQPDCVIVGLALQEDDSIIRAMTEAGADAFVGKHAPTQDLLGTLRRLCAPRPAADRRE